MSYLEFMDTLGRVSGGTVHKMDYNTLYVDYVHSRNLNATVVWLESNGYNPSRGTMRGEYIFRNDVKGKTVAVEFIQ